MCSVNLNKLSLLIVIFNFGPGPDPTPCVSQRPAGLHITISQILRSTVNVPKGRSADVGDVFLRLYGSNFTSPASSYRLRSSKHLLTDNVFDVNKPTVIYAHGYVELTTDNSVTTIIRAYQQNGQYNIVALDWANLGFGNYFTVAIDVPLVGNALGVALAKLIKDGLPLSGVHLVGHSLGVHVLGYAARYLQKRGMTIPRLTGLDAARPGFSPPAPLLATPASARDAAFVDAVHTDAGGYGTPARAARADFWPNGGGAKQPGCLTGTLPFTDEDFCSHWRSWRFWAESVAGGEFGARRCEDYDTFLRRGCADNPLVYMGLKATPDLSGNFYLRTATKEPFALGAAGAD